MLTRRAVLLSSMGATLAILRRDDAMAQERTPDRFETHISTVFNDIEAKAKATASLAEIGTLQTRLSEEWYGAKPGAFLPKPVFERLQTRLGVVSNLLTERFVALKKAAGSVSSETKIVIERDSPTLANFFYAPHYSNKETPSDAAGRATAIAAAEARFGIALPQPLRDLYARQDGGHTDFWLASRETDPPYTFEGEASIVIGEAYDVWLTVLPGMGIAPVTTLKTLGSLSDAIDFGDTDASWRKRLPEVDRLIPISNHGSDIWLCLDYRAGRKEPKVVLFDDTSGGASGKNVFPYEVPDFATFFANLRRHAVTIEHGTKMRGVRGLEKDQ